METETLQHAFVTFLREGLFWGAAFFTVSAFASAAERTSLRASFLAGMGAGLSFGMYAGFSFLPEGSPLRDLWVTGALTATAILFTGPVVILSLGRRGGEQIGRHPLVWAVAGFLLLFFEGGSGGAVLRDYLLTVPSSPGRVLGAALGGAAAGIVPFAVLHRSWVRLWSGTGRHEVLNTPTVLLLLGALGIMAGGVGDFAEQDLLVGLQLGLTEFVGGAVLGLRRILLLEPHPYVEVPWEGLFAFLGGERIGMSLMVAGVFVPPVYLLARIFAAPDPEVGHLGAGARRRQTVAFFRKGLSARAAPVLLVFFLILFKVHAVNLTLNPLFDPQPVPVVADDNGGTIRIPLEDRVGEFTDGKLRRYVYNYGDRKIVFIAIMKPDGSLKTCLDECEICNPAEWNKKARGYAQRGKNLVCKYCVTPIPIHTVGNPGGCNPIPFPSTSDGHYLYVGLDELIGAWRAAEALEKKGTHF